MEGSREPLISGNYRDDYDDDDDDNGNVPDTRTNEGAPGRGPGGDVGKAADAGWPGLFVLLLTFAAGISGLLFGYDTGVVSSTLVSIGTSLSGRELTSMDKSIITSSTSLLALLVSPFSSLLADRLGRKQVILHADVLFVAGAAIQAASRTVAGMVLGRCVIGAAVGAASFAVPLYIAEVAPAAYRGRLVTANVLFITLGQVVAYVVGWAFATYAPQGTGWRWIVGLGALPAVAQGSLVAFMPETPRWLVRMGRVAEAEAVVRKISGGGGGGSGAGPGASASASAVVEGIELEVREEAEAAGARDAEGRFRWLGVWRELLREGKNRRALAIACLLQGLQQLCGFNSLMYFSATIFTIVGFKSPTLTSLVVAVTNFVFTAIALGLIDRIGRRRILLLSVPFMIAGLLLSAYGFSFLSLDQRAATAPAPTDPAPADDGDTRAAGIILASILVYSAAYALGLGNVPWMQSELFPLAVRSVGSGVATATNWSANFVIGLTFLPLMDAMSPSWTFVLYAGICAVGYALIWRIYPETAGLSLEGATALLENGWGVR